jgi:hypothetical protein
VVTEARKRAGPAGGLLALLGRTTLWPLGIASTGDGNCFFNGYSQHKKILSLGYPLDPTLEQLRAWEDAGHVAERSSICDMVEQKSDVQQLVEATDMDLNRRSMGPSTQMRSLMATGHTKASAYAQAMRLPCGGNIRGAAGLPDRCNMC